MISLNRISKLAEMRHWERLLEEVLANGRPLPLAGRMRLADADSAPASALGFALQRGAELAYRPCGQLRSLAARLLSEQRADGSFGGSAAATAVALRGLLSLRRLSEPWPAYVLGEALSLEQLDDAIDAGMHSLASAQAQPRCLAGACGAEAGEGLGWSSPCDEEEDDAGAGAGLIGDGLDTAIALWQLGVEPRFTRAVSMHELARAIERERVEGDRACAQILSLASAVGCDRTSAPLAA